MPGARLTHEDRVQIAAWLAGGLGYAEIGRRLGRQTSTISREVARNGAPGTYQADHAQRAAARRAPRRKRASAGRPAPGGQVTHAVRGFAEHFAALLAATGLPRMSARVFVCLLISESGSLTAAELARQLQVSPASVSKAIAYLEAMDLVVRTPDPGSRRERYLVVDEVWLRAWRTDTSAHAEVAAAAQRGAEILGADTQAGIRLGNMGRFFAWLSDQMSGSGVAGLAVQDALTVLAALVHARAPLAVDELSATLDWARERVISALTAIEHRPAIADPLTLTSAGPGSYGVTARGDRLSPAQRDALDARRAPPPAP